MRYESSPTGQIKDAPTRQMIDKLQRFAQSVAGESGFATKADLADMLAKIRANATIAQQVTTRIITPITPAPTSGDYVARTGDVMSGRLGITLNTAITNGTSEALGILNVGTTSHDQAKEYDGAITYPLGASVAYGGIIWESLQAANIGNAPSAPASAYWTRTAMQASPYVLATWSNAVAYDPPTYPVGTQVLYSGKAYASITAVLTNTNQQPNTSPLYWTPIEFSCIDGPTYAIGDTVVWGIGVYTSIKDTPANIGKVPHAYVEGNTLGNPEYWSVKVPVTVGIQYNGFAKNGNGIGVAFGGACEAWNGPYPTPAQYGVPSMSDRRLIGLEPSVINRNPYSQGAKVALDLTFKNRADVEYSTAMPLGVAGVMSAAGGENRYNAHARATQFSAFPRSSTGEYCGWPTLLKVNEYSTDISADQPYTVIVDMYDQTVDNDGQDTWWWWWATGLPSGSTTVIQPKGKEGGIRYIQPYEVEYPPASGLYVWVGGRMEFHGDIVDGTKIAGWIDFDQPFADWTLAKPLNYDYVNLGTIWKGLQVFDGTGDAIAGSSGCCQFNGLPNFAGGVAAGAGALLGYINVEVGGTPQKIPYYAVV